MTPDYRTHRRNIWVERAIVTARAFDTIDRQFPPQKFFDENRHWTGEVRSILNDRSLSNEGAIEALFSLIVKITAKQEAKTK